MQARTLATLAALLALTACSGGTSDPLDASLDAPLEALEAAPDAAQEHSPPSRACTDPGLPGALHAGVLEVTVDDPPRASTLNLRVHYPALGAGEGAAPDASGAPYPVVILSHGFLMVPATYDYLAAHLASHGFVVVATAHQDSAPRVVERLAQACADIPKAEQWDRVDEAFRAMLEQNHAHRRVGDVATLIDAAAALDADDPTLRGLMDLGRVGMLGHSFGGFTALMAGGAALQTGSISALCQDDPGVADILKIGILPFLTCQVFAVTDPALLTDPIHLREPRVKAMVELAGPVETLWGASLQGLGDLEIPVMGVFTTTDEAVKYDTGPALLFDALPSQNPRYFLSFTGGDHGNFGHIDHDYFDSLTQGIPAGCAYKLFVDLLVGDPDKPPALPEATQHAFTQAAATAFLQAHLADATGCEPYLSAEYYQGLDPAFFAFQP
jgi:predicted dienelactone hydrolase